MSTKTEEYILWLDQVERERDALRTTVERLQAALEKHHWPNLVPGDGPCETCSLTADAWYAHVYV